MSDPVAEAAAQLAQQPQEGGVATAGEPVQPAPAVDGTKTPEQSTISTSVIAEPAADSSGSPLDGHVIAAANEELPNAAPAAVESTTGPASAPSAAGADTTSTIAASSAEPLHVRVAGHLEAIFQMVKTDVERAPTEAEEHAAHVKAHIGDVLHRISNGMEVAEGELVQKLEALYRAL